MTEPNWRSLTKGPRNTSRFTHSLPVRRNKEPKLTGNWRHLSWTSCQGDERLRYRKEATSLCSLVTAMGCTPHAGHKQRAARVPMAT